MAARRYAAYRRENGLVNFADLLLHTRNLLRDHPGARDELAGRFKKVLVDEFQDTDPLQAEIIMHLCGVEPEGGAGLWHQRDVRPGALVVVGDPKQSIYRFRRADIEMFDAVRGIFARSKKARVLKLTTNFRSSPGVAGFVNQLSAELFKKTPGVDIYQAPCEEMRPYLKTPTKHPAVFTLTSQGDLRGKASLLRVEAEKIASFIASAVAGKTFLNDAQYSDFLVITRYRKKLSCYVEALCRRGIPVEVTGAGDLADTNSFQALVQACNVLADPDDPTWLIALLRGPLFGASDAELRAWMECMENADPKRKRFGIYNPPPAGLDKELAGRVGRLYDRLKTLRTDIRRLPHPAAVGTIVGKLGIRVLALASEMPSQELGGLEKVLEMVRTMHAGGGGSFEDAVALINGINDGGHDAMSMEPARGEGRLPRGAVGDGQGALPGGRDRADEGAGLCGGPRPVG